MTNEAKPQYGGSLLGFFKGTQSLASAFWLLGVVPAITALLAVMMIKQIIDPSFAKLMLITFCLTIPFRLVAWFSVFRCIKNTNHAMWSGLAGVIVVVDILHKAIFWPIVWNSYHSNLQSKSEFARHIEICETALSKVSGYPKDKIYSENYKVYEEGKTSHYRIYFFDKDKRMQRYKCWVSESIPQLEKER